MKKFTFNICILIQVEFEYNIILRKLILKIGTVNATEQNSVHFVMLPTNATHLLALSSLETDGELY